MNCNNELCTWYLTCVPVIPRPAVAHVWLDADSPALFTALGAVGVAAVVALVLPPGQAHHIVLHADVVELLVEDVGLEQGLKDGPNSAAVCRVICLISSS
jgi:hypothetical protein